MWGVDFVNGEKIRKWKKIIRTKISVLLFFFLCYFLLYERGVIQNEMSVQCILSLLYLLFYPHLISFHHLVFISSNSSLSYILHFFFLFKFVALLAIIFLLNDYFG